MRVGWSRPGFWAALGLAALVWAIYFQTGSFPFIRLDDPLYVADNPWVRSGLCWNSVRWAFTTGWSANWHPLTWLSHMLDVSLFGPAPGPQHLVSAAIHAANALLLFRLLRVMTRDLWPSALVAALFAVHPLHVESVAWIAERKDVLSTLFAFLTLLAYHRYVATGSRRALGGAVVLYGLGLMAKPMLVSLPLLMLCLDRWPLARAGVSWRRRVLEKVPFFLLALGSVVVTILVQRRGGAVAEWSGLPLWQRGCNAAASGALYLAKAVWPVRLAVFYPYPPASALPWMGALGTAALLLVSAAVLRWGAKRPYLATGWWWYLISLLPVIGLVQVGSQAMADRYTYLPLVGPFLAGVWLVTDFWRRLRLPSWTAWTGAAAILLPLALLARNQASLWRDDLTLFSHAADATQPTNWVAHLKLGEARLAMGRPDLALPELALAAGQNPRTSLACYLQGEALTALGRREEALASLREALRRQRDDYRAMYRAAQLLSAMGRPGEAADLYRGFLQLEPLRLRRAWNPVRERSISQEARKRLCLTLRQLGRPGEAIEVCRAGLAADPANMDFLFNLGLALGEAGRHREAVAVLRLCAARCLTQPFIQQALQRELAASAP
jgi:tetratricopeptide (TPR) repeat protein